MGFGEKMGLYRHLKRGREAGGMVGLTQGGCFARVESKRHVDIWPQELSRDTEGLRDTQRLGLNSELEGEIYSDMWGCKGSSGSILVQQQSALT